MSSYFSNGTLSIIWVTLSLDSCGVPQSFVLATFCCQYTCYHSVILFNITMYLMTFTLTTLGYTYMPLQPTDPSSHSNLTSCLSNIKSLSQSFLKFNNDKTEMILFGNSTRLLAADLGNWQIILHIITNQRVIFDSDFCLDAQVKNDVKTCFFHLKIISKIK